MKPLYTRFLAVLITLAFLGIADSTFAAKKDCEPTDTRPKCNPDDGGGDDGGLGSAIPMNCLLGASWGDDPRDTINDDTSGWYEDAVDRVTCSIEGPSVPWPIYLKVWRDKGKPPNSVRKVDVALGGFDEESQTFKFNEGTFNDFYKTLDKGDWSEGAHYLADSDLYPDFFSEASGALEEDGPNMDEMDALRLNVRPYRGDPILEDPTQTAESIHRLAWKAEGYEMGMHFGKPDTGIDRFAISIASKHYEGNESFTGISCESGYEAEILTHSPEPGGAMRDVSVYLWRDFDGDGLADGYTVTTGKFGEIADSLEGPPDVEPGARWAAVCSAVGDKTCGNPKAPSNCNFLGYVEIQFTLHACASERCK